MVNKNKSLQKTEPKSGLLKRIWHEATELTVGVFRLASIACMSIGAYVLWFSSDSLTLHVVAVGLAIRAAWEALALSRSKQ